MMRRAFLVVCWTAFCLNTLTVAQSSRRPEDRTISPQVPLEAELLMPLNAAKLVRGASVLAKAKADWNDPVCHLRVGSVIGGHIVDFEQRSKLNKGSTLTIAFDHAECEDHNTPFQFVLFAVVAAPQEEWSPTNQPIDLFGSGSRPVGGMAGGTTAPPSVAGGALIDLRQESGIRNSSSNSKLPPSINSGQVIGINKVTLSVGTGPEGASVLSSPKDNIRLERATQLILIPKRDTASMPVPGAAANTKLVTEASTSGPTVTPLSAPQPIVPPEVDETSICSTSCSLVPTDAGAKPSQASLTLAINSLGYTPHDLGDHVAFGFESTLSYLDADNILFTYDPHRLRQRVPSGFRTETMRTVRAVLLNPANLTVKRIVDWQIQGDGQYIWHAGPGKVLVHLGHNLRLLGPDLTVLRQIPIPGQLVFVSTSSTADHIAVGTLHERHTRNMHNDLVETLNGEPEEDVEVQLFDQNLSLLLSTRQDSSAPPPVLSEAGEILVNSIGRNRWRIREMRWDRTDHTIATVASGCRPKTSTPLPNSVFLIGCASPLESWYRMVRLDGHLILNGHGSSQDMELSSSSNQDEFAIRVVRAQKSKSHGEHFRKQDLKEQEVSIYRPTDGKRLFFTATPGVSLAQQSFAISPTGAQLAVLSDVAISLYQIAKPTPLPTSSESSRAVALPQP